MRKVNYKKKQQLKNIGTAMALTIALITYNVSTKTYAMELETKVSTYSTIEQEELSAKVVDKKYNNREASMGLLLGSLLGIFISNTRKKKYQ